MKNEVRELRLRRGWTQKELAEKVGASRQTVVGIEAGHQEPGLRLAVRIAQAFTKPVEEVFRS